jgi:hypothetical protein
METREMATKCWYEGQRVETRACYAEGYGFDVLSGE